MKYLLIILIFLVGCNTEIRYKVPKGKHRSTLILRVLKDNVINYSFTTDSTWIWDKPDKNGYSKVTGIAWGSNHKNSVRVVYMRLDSIGVLGYYYYVNGTSPQDNHVQKGILDTITIGQSYYGRLGWENGYYFIGLNNKHHSLKVDKPKGMKTLANPYIGGTYTINHDWTTTITLR